MMKIICTLNEAAEIIRICKDAACCGCALQKVCNDKGLADKRPEKLMEICKDVDRDE